MTTLLQETALLLLSRPNIIFSGVLDQKIEKPLVHYWTSTYVIILDGNIYIYENKSSKKPRSAVVLSSFKGIDIFKRPNKSYPWTFVLKSNIDTVPSMKFSAPSEQDLLKIVEDFKRGISISNGINFPQTDIQESLSSFYSSGNRENVYYEIADELPSIPDDYINTQMRNDDFIFKGNRDEAIKELSKRFHVGSFLIRLDEGKHVLTVQLEKNIVKYIIVRNASNNTVSIQGDINHFPNLTEMVRYYHQHPIPNYTLKLEIPYKLVRKG